MTAALSAPATPARFGWFWTGGALSAIGDRLTGFAVPSLAILVLGASGTEVGVLAALGWLAYPVFGVLAGALVAHAPQRRIMVAGELVRLAVFASIPLAAAFGALTTTQLFAVVAIAGVATVFVDIAGFVYLPGLVGADFLVRANSRLQATDSLSKLVGPALAGAAMQFAGPFLGVLLSSLPFAASAASRARLPADRGLADVPREPVRARIRQGLSFLWGHALLRPIVTASAVRNFGMGAVDAVLLLFAYRVLGLSSLTGGLLLAAGAVGAITGTFLVSRVSERIGVRAALLLTGLEGLTWLLVPLCLVLPAFAVPLLVLIRMFSAFWMPMWNVITTSVRQALTPPDRQSTVHAAARTVMSSPIPLGSVLGGVLGSVLTAALGAATGLVVLLAAGGLCAGLSVLLINRVATDL